MRTRLKCFLFLTLLGIAAVSFGQSATFTEDIGDEADVRTGTKYIEIKLDRDTFYTNDFVKTAILNGLKGSSTEFDAVIEAAKGDLATNVVFSEDDTVVSIRIHQFSSYYITDDDSIGISIPDTALIQSSTDWDLADSIIITNLLPSVVDGGDMETTATENSVRAGGNTYELVLTDNLWHPDIETDAGMLTAIQDMFTGTVLESAADDLMSTDLEASDHSFQKLVITFNAKSNFYIATDQTINLIVPSSLLQYNEAFSTATTSFIISNDAPVISITDTTYSESDIQTKDIVFIITLQGDIWESGISGTFHTNILSGGEWDTDIMPTLDVSRRSDTEVRVRIPQNAAFNIDTDENVTFQIDGDEMQNTNSGLITAANDHTVQAAAVGLTPGGSFTPSIGEGAIRTTPVHYIELSISEDTWVTDVSSNATNRTNLINSIISSDSDDGFTDLINAIKALGESGVVRNGDGTKVTIEVPVINDFDVTQSISLSFTNVPGSLFTVSSANLSTAVFTTINRIEPYIVITTDPTPLSEPQVDNAILIVNLYEDTFANGSFSRSNFSFSTDPSAPELEIDSDDDIDLYGDDSLRIGIRLNGNITQDITVGLSIDEHELVGGDHVENKSTNTFVISSQIEPVITSVSIPDDTMKIGDLVEVTIVVDEEDGSNFGYTSGTVADRDLTGFTYSGSGDTYYAYFTVNVGTTEYFASENIPVTSLILNNSGTEGGAFSDLIVQANDPIDTDYPVVDLIDFNNGEYKIGDEVAAVIHATESGLFFDDTLTKINSIPLYESNVTSNESGSGIYQLYYTVSDGNPNLFSGTINVNVVMKDSAGNKNSAFSTISGTSPKIDANYPVLTSASVTSTGEKIPGDIIEISIVSTEAIHELGAGSHVNNVSDIGSSPGEIEMVSDLDNSYTLTYTVGPDDDEVVSYGDMTALIILIDEFGNETQTTILDVNNVEIITTAPSAHIYGGGGICPGDSIELFVNLVGEAPFTLEISDGTTVVPHIAPDESFSFYVTNTGPDSYPYTVHDVKDKWGISGGAGSGVANVVMHDVARAYISNIRTAFQVTDQGQELTVLFPPLQLGEGTWSGIGVVSSERLFYPSIAGITDSTMVYFDFEETATGCTGKDSIEFSVVKEQAELLVPDFICYNSTDSIIRGTNLNNPGNPGFLRMTEVVGKIELDKSQYLDSISPEANTTRAKVLADQLRRGTYKIYYYYLYGTDSVHSTITKTFTLDFIDEVKFLKPAEHSELISNNYNVCRNDEAKLLETNLDDRDGGTYEWIIEIDNGVEYDDPDWLFKPSQAKVGYFRIDYTYTSDAGCSQSANFYVSNNNVPELGFKPDGNCISADGGTIQFLDTTNLLNTPGIVSRWNWNFGDGDATESENNFQSLSQENPTHTYSTWGKKSVTLTTTGPAPKKCVATLEKEIDLAVTPITNFGWNSDCYAESDVLFDNQSEFIDGVDRYDWRIIEEDGPLDTAFSTATKQDTLKYPFKKLTDYNIRLVAKNTNGCADSITRLLLLKPTFKLSVAGYNLEEFNESKGKWSTDRVNLESRNSWTYGVPDFIGYVPPLPTTDVPVDYAWYTDLTPWYEQSAHEDSSYVEGSWMQSPCFDFRGIERPMIRMDIMKSFDPNRDGAVLQYTTDDGKNWTTIGSTNEGIEWYNSFDIGEQPGGNPSSIGWAGKDNVEPDSVWVTAAHDLDELREVETVIFGVFYATDGASKVDKNNGFAIDNIYVGERTKRALIEHFTNSGTSGAAAADTKIDDFTANNELDVTNLQYHMHYFGADDMNANNSAPGSSRSFYYGVTSLPYALLDGGIDPSYIYDDIENIPPIATQVKELTLEDPLFELDVIFKLFEQRLSTTIDIKALHNITDTMDIVLNVAVVEKSITRYSGTNGNIDEEFKNVVLAMLPSSAGMLYSKPWDKNDSTDVDFSWTYMGDVDTSEVMIVAFLQDRETDKILQVASEDEPVFAVAIVKHEIKTLKLYPNPAYNELYIEFGEQVSAEGFIEITDMTGRTVMIEEIYAQDQKVRLDINLLKEGAYILQTKENGIITSRTNFIKVR